MPEVLRKMKIALEVAKETNCVICGELAEITCKPCVCFKCVAQATVFAHKIGEGFLKLEGGKS